MSRKPKKDGNNISAELSSPKIDASSDASFCLSANADVLGPASNKTGFSADGSGAPLASDASLGLPASRSNTPGNEDFMGIGPDDVLGDFADNSGDGAAGNRPFGSLTGGDVRPQGSSGRTNSSAGGDAPLGEDASLGLLAGQSTSQGDDNVLGVGPNNVDGDLPNPVGDGASGDQPPDLLIRGNVNPLPSRGASDGNMTRGVSKKMSTLVTQYRKLPMRADMRPPESYEENAAHRDDTVENAQNENAPDSSYDSSSGDDPDNSDSPAAASSSRILSTSYYYYAPFTMFSKFYVIPPDNSIQYQELITKEMRGHSNLSNKSNWTNIIATVEKQLSHLRSIVGVPFPIGT